MNGYVRRSFQTIFWFPSHMNSCRSYTEESTSLWPSNMRRCGNFNSGTKRRFRVTERVDLKWKKWKSKKSDVYEGKYEVFSVSRSQAPSPSDATCIQNRWTDEMMRWVRHVQSWSPGVSVMWWCDAPLPHVPLRDAAWWERQRTDGNGPRKWKTLNVRQGFSTTSTWRDKEVEHVLTAADLRFCWREVLLHKRCCETLVDFCNHLRAKDYLKNMTFRLGKKKEKIHAASTLNCDLWSLVWALRVNCSFSNDDASQNETGRSTTRTYSRLCHS